jgi:hypothetical protein
MTVKRKTRMVSSSWISHSRPWALGSSGGVLNFQWFLASTGAVSCASTWMGSSVMSCTVTSRTARPAFTANSNA